MSIKLDSELTFVAALFNKEVYDAVASLLDDFPWKTKAAQRIFEDRSVPLYEWSPESLFVILSNIMLPEEIQGIIDLIAGMSTPRSPAELKELVATIFSHYKRTRASDLIEKYNNDINKLILKIKEIPDDIATVTEVEPLGARRPSEVLESELGGLDRIIPSNFGVIKEATPFKGYLPGQVVMVCASPGCFTGDTEVLSLDSGKYYTMQELYESQEKDIGVYSFDIENNRFEVSKGKYCQLTKETDDLVEVELEDGTVFRCTPDHKFLLESGEYVEAQYLTPEMEIKELKQEMNRFKIYREDREGVVQPNGSIYPTHRLVADHKAKSGENAESAKTIAHHKEQPDGTFNPLDNRIHMIEMMTKSDHDRLHKKKLWENLEYRNQFLESGKSTRLTSERVSKDNYIRWESKDYRKKMAKITSKNGSLVTLTRNKKHPKYNGQVTKILGVFVYFDKLISDGISLTLDLENKIDELRIFTTETGESYYRVGPRTPSLKSIIKYFGSFENAIKAYYEDHLGVPYEG